MNNLNTIIRHASIFDLNEIYSIQKHVYDSNLIESKYIFASIIIQGYSIVTVDLKTNKIIGFLLAHPSELDQVHFLNKIPKHPRDEVQQCMFIHDMSVLPQYHNKKIGSDMYHFFTYKLKYTKYNTIQLISVNNTYPFWSKLGFACKQKVQDLLTDDLYENYSSSSSSIHDIAFMETIL